MIPRLLTNRIVALHEEEPPKVSHLEIWKYNLLLHSMVRVYLYQNIAQMLQKTPMHPLGTFAQTPHPLGTFSQTPTPWVNLPNTPPPGYAGATEAKSLPGNVFGVTP